MYIKYRTMKFNKFSEIIYNPNYIINRIDWPLYFSLFFVDLLVVEFIEILFLFFFVSFRKFYLTLMNCEIF